MSLRITIYTYTTYITFYIHMHTVVYCIVLFIVSMQPPQVLLSNASLINVNIIAMHDRY